MSHGRIDEVLPGKTVLAAHRHDAHGHALRLDFTDGTSLYAWAFGDAYHLEMVLCDTRSDRIVEDMRSEKCRAHNAAWDARYVARWPHLHGPGGREPLPPFRIDSSTSLPCADAAGEPTNDGGPTDG